MSQSLVLVTHRGSLGVLTLNRPEARNPLDGPMAEALLAGMEQHFADPDVRSIAIAAAGEAFCAGGDLRQMRQLRAMPTEEAYAWPGAIVALHQRMLDAPKPVIALVDGAAFAGGMGIAGMCDVIVASERASFAMPEVRIGMFPMIIIAHLVRSLPRKALLEMMLTGEAIDAAEAHRLAFVSKLEPDAEAMWQRADALAAAFAQVSPVALRLGRKTFGILADMPASQALDAAQFLNLTFFMGSDLEEGANAFLEGRPPSWQDES